jgi:hypothetical protein
MIKKYKSMTKANKYNRAKETNKYTTNTKIGTKGWQTYKDSNKIRILLGNYSFYETQRLAGQPPWRHLLFWG